LAPITLVYGGVLILLGVGGYFGTGSTSPTALIPAGFGLVLVVCGLLARKDHLRKHVMHTAVLVGLIGFVVPAVRALPKVPELWSDGKVVNAEGKDMTAAVELQLAMAVICLVFVGQCVNSFIQARRRRRAAEEVAAG
jgi:hypothetical protein